MKGRRRPNNDIPHAKRKRVNNPKRNDSVQDKQEENFEEDYVEIDQKPSAYELLLASLGTNTLPEEEEVIKDEPKIPIIKQFTEENEQEDEEEDEEEIEVKSKKNKKSSNKNIEEKGEEGEEEEEEEEEEQLGENEINTIKAELKKEKAQNADDYFAIQTLTKLSKEQIEKINENKKFNYKKDKLENINQFFKKYEIGDVQYADVIEENADFDKSIKKFESIKEISDLELSNTKKIKKEYSEFLGNYFLKNKLKINFENEINKVTKDYFKLRKHLTSIYTDFIPLPNSMNLFKHFCGFFPLFNEYFDVLHSACDELHTFPLRQAYLLHSLNHCLKAQDKVVKNTHKVNQLQTEEKILKRKIKEKEKEYFLSQKDKGKGKKKKLPKEVQEKIDKIQEKIEKIQEKQNEISEKVQDQGFTRARVLILVPSQEIAGNLVELIMKFINKSQVHHKSRFYEHFLPEDRDLEPHQFKPFDYNVLFNGNTNDAFYICLQFSFHSIKLFSDPLKSDIIISSPLGVRSIIDKSDQRGRFDFLSSIEVLVLDFSDFFLMQNWDHVSYIFKHINCVPQLQRDIDFSRVKPYFLDGLGKYHRQTIITSRILTPEIQGVFNKNCFNFRGKIKVQKTPTGVVSNVFSQVPQRFEKVLCKTVTDIDKTRFDYFTQDVLAQLRNSTTQAHTLIFIPSYFDFIQLRNYFKKEHINFLSVTEYTSNSDIARNRHSFLQGKTDYLLVTERFYFFRRYKFRGIKNLVFYAPPVNALFYQELVNLIDSGEGSCLLLYISPYDQLAVQRIVGASRCKKMLSSPKNSHMIVSG